MVVHVDLFYLPRVRGYPYRAVLLTIDSFTKFIEAHPLEAMTAKEVFEMFENQIIYRYGAPTMVVSDNGPEFLKEFRIGLERRDI